MILSIVLVPLLFFILTVVTVGNPAIVPPHNGFVDPMEDEPRVLSPEVVAKVNENWLRDVKASTGKDYEKDYIKFQVKTSPKWFFKNNTKFT